MRIKISHTIVLLFCLIAGQVYAAETPPIVETFACNLASGKDSKDIESATSFWRQQVEKLDNEDLNQYTAWSVFPVRSSLPADFFWLGASPNMNVWARGAAAYAQSAEGAAADAKFAKLGKCTSNVWSSELLYGEPPSEENARGVLEVFGCSLKKGKTISNVRAVEENFTKTAKAAGIDMNVFRFSPVYTNGETDLLYFIGHDDIAAMGATNTTIFTTDATRTANQYFSLVMDCGGGVYSVDLIKAGTAAAGE